MVHVWYVCVNLGGVYIVVVVVVVVVLCVCVCVCEDKTHKTLLTGDSLTKMYWG